MNRDTSERTASNRERALVSEGLLRIDEACRIAGVGKSFLYLAMQRGELVYVMLGAARRIPKRALLDWLAGHVVMLEGAFNREEE